MANAKSKSHNKNYKKSKRSARQDEEVHLAAFLNIRQGYLPGEQLLLNYVVDDQYSVNPGDSVALQKCGDKSPQDLNPYRWPVSTVRVGTSFRTRLALPNPDRRLKNNEYQFIYISFTNGKIIGRSRAFKISDIIEIENEVDENEPGLEATLEASSLDSINSVERELFEEPITRPRPLRIANISRSTDSVEPDQGRKISSELNEALLSEASTESMVRVAELIRQYERIYGMPKKVQQQVKAPETQLMTSAPKPVMTTAKAKVAQLIQSLKEENISNRGAPVHSGAEDDLFMEKFLFPFISGVLEYLMRDGYSAIICRDNRTVLLENSGQKTLDLRQGWASSQRSAMRELEESSQVSVEELAQLCKQLEDDLESVRHDSEVRELHYVAELRKSQAKEMRVVNKKIRKLERQVRSLQTATNFTKSTVQDHRRKGDAHLEEVDVLQSEMGSLQDINDVLAAHVKVLEQEMSDKVAEYEALYQLFIDAQHPQPDPIDTMRLACNVQHKHLQQKNKTKEEAKSSEHTPPMKMAGACRPLVQKATSYAASSVVDSEKTSTSKERKQTATSERRLSDSPIGDQESWLKLMKRLLVTDNPASPLAQSRLENCTVNECKSSESLAVAMKRLFNIYSSPSLDSTTTSSQSVETSDSVLEAIRSMFASDTSLTEHKSNSYPATPCNSVDNIKKNKKSKLGEVKQSSSLKDVLRWLFHASDDDLKQALPGASNESITSLGEAMKRLFNEESLTSVEEKGLSTSNESLSQAMHLLFDTLSQQSLNGEQLTDSKSSTSSLGSVLWSLTDPVPEEFKKVDIREYNQQRQMRHEQTAAEVSKEQCDCHRDRANSCEQKNPNLSSVIRSSSPVRDANISFPSASSLHHQRPSMLLRSKANIMAPIKSNSHDKETDMAGKDSSAPASAAKQVTSAATDAQSQNTFRSRSSSKRAKQTRALRMAKKTCPHCNLTLHSAFRMRQHIQLAHSDGSELDN